MSDVQTTIEKVNGFKVAGVHCGLKKDGKLDFALIVSDTPCTAAGVFTTNYVKAAPVLVDMERLKHHAHHIRAVAVNTASANACANDAKAPIVRRLRRQSSRISKFQSWS